jgi:ECF sigma factor
MMRRILVDYAREHRTAKRPGAGVKVTLDDHIGAAQPIDCEILLLDRALSDLSLIDPRQASHRRAAILWRTVRAASGDVVVALAGDRDTRMANRPGVDVSEDDEDGAGN